MNSNENLELLERYTEGLLNEAEKLDFAKKMQNEPSFAQALAEYQLLRKNLEKYKQRQDLKNKLQVFQTEIDEENSQVIDNQSSIKIIPFWRKYAATLALVASVSLISIFTTVFTLNYLNSFEKQQTNYYQALRRDLNAVKKEQAVIAKQQKTQANAKTRQYGATAFVISANGYLVTNYHVIKNADSIYLENTMSKTWGKMKAEAVFWDKNTDLAILKVIDKDFKGFAPLPYVFRNQEVDLGENVFTLAYPRKEMVYGEGSISAKTGFADDTTAYQISIPVNPGNSGSPLFDAQGNLIGVVSGKQADMEGATFAVKARYLQMVIENMQKKLPENQVFRAQWSGIQYLNRPNQIKRLQDLVFVVNVYDSK